jgi:tetratricopeptide (TPR) repeat protein
VLAAGSRVGSYRVIAPLGMGGMGVVYKAEDEATRRLVALKVILPEHARDAASMARLGREARAAAAIAHPNVTALYQAGQHQGAPFLAFEYVAGGTLEERIRGRGPLPWREAAERGAEVASGLVAIHAAGLVHRDLKPANVLLDANGHAKVGDLGLVRRVGTGSKGLTDEGTILGTYAYMAPEQAEGASGVDARADLYSLGALLFTLLTGRPPFEGSGIATLTRVMRDAPVPVRTLAPETPVALEHLVARLLAKDPAARPSTASVALDELRAIASGKAEIPRRRLLPFLLGGLAAVVLGAVAFVLIRPARSDAPPPGPPPVSATDSEAKRLAERGREKLDAKDLDGALVDETRAIQLDPGLAIAWQNRGVVRATRGDLDGGVADLTRAIELAPAVALAWHDRGVARGKKGDWDGEIADCTVAIERDPRLAWAWHNRGAARVAMLRYDEAFADLSRAIELAPELAPAWELRGRVRRRKGDLDGALADLGHAIELAPNYADAWHDRGAVYAAKGDTDAAIAQLTRTVELAPGDASAWKDRAAARLDKMDVDGAIADTTRAIELAPKFADAWAERAAARANKSGDPDAPVADATKAIELAPTLALAWVVRGHCRRKKGDVPGAVADLEHGLELQPSGPLGERARRWLAEIKATGR